MRQIYGKNVLTTISIKNTSNRFNGFWQSSLWFSSNVVQYFSLFCVTNVVMMNDDCYCFIKCFFEQINKQTNNDEEDKIMNIHQDWPAHVYNDEDE